MSEGRFKVFVRPIFNGITGVQLFTAALADRAGHPSPSSAEAARLQVRVTMVVKTFERPRTVRRLLRSVRRVFPGRIIVADDSRVPRLELGEGVDVIPLPFNVGLSAGRTAALSLVETEYVFVTDDDIVFTRASDVVAMMEYLDDHREVDIIALQLVNLPMWFAFDSKSQALYPGALPPLRQIGEEIGGATVVPMVKNVFLARTSSIRAVRWDPNLRLVEHVDFFSRASGRLVTVQADGVRAYHVRTPYDPSYMRYRQDMASAYALLARKWPQPEETG